VKWTVEWHKRVAADAGAFRITREQIVAVEELR